MTPENFLSLTNPLKFAFLLLDSDGIIVCCNKSATKFTGLLQSEVIGTPLTEIVADQTDSVARYLSKCARSTSLTAGSLVFRNTRGDETKCRCDGASLARNPDQTSSQTLLLIQTKKASSGVFSALNDQISQLNKSRRILEEKNQLLEATVLARTAELEDSESRTRMIIETAPDGIITLDSAGTIETFNFSAEWMFGYSEQEVVGKNLSLLMDTTDHEGESYELEGIRKSGTTFPIEMTVSKTHMRDELAYVHVIRDITDRKEAETALAELNSSLQTMSRQAGMAEIATGVLHNIGNVLNSVNVAALLMRDRFRKSKLDGLDKTVKLLEQHAGDLGEYVTTDKSGKFLPDYLGSLSTVLTGEHDNHLEDLGRVTKNIEHIKQIVQSQLRYATASNVIQTSKVSNILDDALTMQQASFERNGITITREFEDLPDIEVDKNNLLQILTNLISNAKYAILCNENNNKFLILKTIHLGENRICIKVTDSGEGIEADKLDQIFTFGFTTKKSGHGFGLHSAANMAKTMGGTLIARSPGLNQGATFTLELPVYSEQEATLV